MVYPKINRTWDDSKSSIGSLGCLGKDSRTAVLIRAIGCIKHWPTTEIISLSSHKFVIWLANCRRNNYIPIAYTYSSNIKFRWAFWKWCIAAYNQSFAKGYPIFISYAINRLNCNQLRTPAAQLGNSPNHWPGTAGAHRGEPFGATETFQTDGWNVDDDPLITWWF